MAFCAGQTFLYPLSENKIAHLWVIATEPNTDGVFAVVSLTSLRQAQDQTVILRKDEHPFLKHDTCVCYGLAEITGSEKLQAFMDTGLAKPHRDIEASILAEIVSGFTASDYTKKRVRDFVRDYRAQSKASHGVIH